MKKFFFSMMAMLAFAGSAIAQGPKFIVDDVMMDENGKGTITVKFEFDKDDYYGNFQMDMLLPDEFTPVTGRNGIKADQTSMIDGDFALASSVLTVAEEKDINYGKKVLRLIGSCNNGYAIIGQQGVLLTVPVTCATTVDGAFDVKLNNILINVATLFSDDTDNPDRGQEIRPEEVNFKIVAGETVGIREVQGTSQDGTVYNLNGQRVQKAQKGLFIENGKKVVKK